jgi:hypothetical protein
MNTYCIMGNPGAGNSPALSQTQTDAKFPIQFRYFEAETDDGAWQTGCAIGMRLGCDGVYVFACDNKNKIVSQITRESREERTVRLAERANV